MVRQYRSYNCAKHWGILAPTKFRYPRIRIQFRDVEKGQNSFASLYQRKCVGVVFENFEGE